MKKISTIYKRSSFIIAALLFFCPMITETFGQCASGFTFTVNNNSVQFTNTSTSTSTGLTYSWDFDDGNISTAITPGHIYQSTGSYLVCLTMVDDTAGCTDLFCDTVVITTLPPVSAAWTQKANFSGSGRQWPIGFSIGNIGYIGTGWDGSNYSNDLWAYDPLTDAWTQKANFGGSARYGAVSFVIGNKAHVGLGYGPAYKTDLWEYDPSINTWTQKASFPGTARANAVGFSINNKGYVGTGYDGNVRKDFWEYDPSTNAWTLKATFPGAARNQAIGFSIGNKGYLGTGYDMMGTWYNDFWQYNPVNNSWTAIANYTGVTRSSAVSFVLDGEGYVGAGEKGFGTSYKDFWKYDTISNGWTLIPDLTGAARGRAVGFAIGNYNGYVGLGESYFDDFWQYSSCTVPTPSVAITGNDTICENDSVLLSTTFSASNYQWYINSSPIAGAIQQSYWATQSGQYSVSADCSSPSLPLTITALGNNTMPSICIVTVDSAIGKNIIVWEELSDAAVVSYNIYKETTQAGIYGLVGNNPVSSLSEFTDVSSNPAQVAARYKITSIDTCGNESAQSANHKTLHLTIGLGIFPAINLNWGNYEGITFGKYHIWRGVSKGNLVLIDSIQSTLTSYTDLNPPTGTNYYAIQVIYPQGCNPTVKSLPSSSSSFSNIENTATISGITERESSIQISLFPNPTNGSFSINCNEAINHIEIFNKLGERIYKSKINEPKSITVDISEIPAGIYFVTIKSGNNYYYKKLLKQ